MTEQQHWPSLSASRPSIKASMDPSSGSTLIAFNDNPNVVNRRIRWRKGELIGAGAFGSVYMGMNLDSGELLAVKQVLIAAKNVGRERSQAHIRELEEELKLLQNLSHPNIVRYLGTAREDDALNIFLEFVPGGSIASLLRKFGSFPEPVIRTYSRQLLQGLEYLHKNGIMHRDIKEHSYSVVSDRVENFVSYHRFYVYRNAKGANILVDNKGCIKLADFGASKQVVELVTISGAKSMKGTPYWMAPEVIRQTGHSLPADIWSVGCTIIEMATGKAPWSQQFQEVTALFHIGTTKSHPPIPEHLSNKAQDFLRKCLRKEPYLRPTVSELLEHPFIKVGDVPRVLGPSQALRGIASSQALESSKKRPLFDDASEESCLKRSAVFCEDSVLGPFNSWRCSSTNKDSYAQRESFKSETNCSVRFDCGSFMTRSFKSACDNPFTGREWGQNGPLTEHSSFNPMNEPADADDGWCNLASPEPQKKIEVERMPTANSQEFSYMEDANFHFPCPPADDDDDDEVTESKIKAFLDEKALELKQLQTPLYMEYQSIWNMPSPYRNEDKNGTRSCDVQEQEGPNEDSALSLVTGTHLSASHSTRSSSKRSSRSGLSIRCSRASEATVSSDSPRVNELKRLLLETQQPLRSPSNLSSLDRQRLWKEELQQELDMRREERRKLAQVTGRTKCSPTPASKLAASSRPQTSSRKLLVL